MFHCCAVSSGLTGRDDAAQVHDLDKLRMHEATSCKLTFITSTCAGALQTLFDLKSAKSKGTQPETQKNRDRAKLEGTLISRSLASAPLRLRMASPSCSCAARM